MKVVREMTLVWGKTCAVNDSVSMGMGDCLTAVRVAIKVTSRPQIDVREQVRKEAIYGYHRADQRCDVQGSTVVHGLASVGRLAGDEDPDAAGERG